MQNMLEFLQCSDSADWVEGHSAGKNPVPNQRFRFAASGPPWSNSRVEDWFNNDWAHVCLCAVLQKQQHSKITRRNVFRTEKKLNIDKNGLYSFT